MLFLLFELDGERYALDATEIAEVLPLAATKAIPGAPAWVSGLLMHRGVPVPVIDVPRLALGRCAQPLRSTRLVLVHYPLPSGGAPAAASAPGAGPGGRLLGLVVERATQTARFARGAFRDGGIDTPHARWLGPVASDADGVVQWVGVRDLLDDDVRALLFAREPDAGEPPGVPTEHGR